MTDAPANARGEGEGVLTPDERAIAAAYNRAEPKEPERCEHGVEVRRYPCPLCAPPAGNTDWRLAYREAEGQLEAQQDEIAALRSQLSAAERDAAQFVQRYGTPFDPTGAKTGIEIQSLAARVRALEAERDAWKRYAQHLYACAKCQGYGINHDNCTEGKQLAAAARAANATGANDA